MMGQIPTIKSAAIFISESRVLSRIARQKHRFLELKIFLKNAEREECSLCVCLTGGLSHEVCFHFCSFFYGGCFCRWLLIV